MSWSCIDARGCEFRDSKHCLKCGVSFAALKAESARELVKLRAAVVASTTEEVQTQEQIGHNFADEPTDDSIAALQHEVASRRARRDLDEEHLEIDVARRQVLACLASTRPMATEWLVAAALAMECYELEKEREG